MIKLLHRMKSLHMQPLHLHKGAQGDRETQEINDTGASLPGGLNVPITAKRFSPRTVVRSKRADAVAPVISE